MINRISIFLLLGLFVTHATGMNTCLFKLIYFTTTEIEISKKLPTNNPTSNIDPEEEVKEEAYQEEDNSTNQITDWNTSNNHIFNSDAFPNYLLEIVSPPPEV